jgi:hypothetical protein
MDFFKYIVVLMAGQQEQAVVFPMDRQHSEIAHQFSKPAIGAGLCALQGDSVAWHGSRSETLDVDSRPQDLGALRAMLAHPPHQRQRFDLRKMKMPAVDAWAFACPEPPSL